jgi:peptidyl-prolyl cis-trans isomerase C
MRYYIAPLLVLVGLAGIARAQTDPKAIVATVNGRSFTLGEVEAVLKTRPLPIQLPKEKTQQMRFEVVCMMIDSYLWEQYLHKNGPSVKAEVDKYMAEAEAEANKKGKQSLADFCKEEGQTIERLREIVTLEFQWATLARQKISDADVKHYYDENKDFFDGVRVHASHILIRVAANASEADKQAAREKLLAIRAHLVAGTLDFADAAKRYSQDATAAQGGDLGTFPRKMFYDETLSRTAFSLPEGGISDVVQNDYGLQLVKVVERKPAEQPSEYEKIKDFVRDFCTDELRAATLQKLRKEADIKISMAK